MKQREPFGALQEELAGERAHALGRIAARMERALAELRDFDEAAAADVMLEGESKIARQDLVAAAAEWVWFYVVQRDVLGWHQHEEALRHYDVPAEVIVKMGPRPRPRG